MTAHIIPVSVAHCTPSLGCPLCYSCSGEGGGHGLRGSGFLLSLLESPQGSGISVSFQSASSSCLGRKQDLT